MKLLNTTSLRLETFLDGVNIPYYAILSHTWNEDEVLYEDICDESIPLPEHKAAGFAKVRGSCDLARKDGLDYIWIDTCCIDKRSSAELSEAINSMFRWYRESSVCYAYLIDVVPRSEVSDGEDLDLWTTCFQQSRWFTRGWTLQELIAPCQVAFLDRDWNLLGYRHNELLDLVHGTTKICKEVLDRMDCNDGDLRVNGCMPPEVHLIRRGKCAICHGKDLLPDLLRLVPVAVRMAWASRRQTTRQEDSAYSLLGLFNIHMPLIYGEGKGAFERLQMEILRSSDDISILGWREIGLPLPRDQNFRRCPALAAEVSAFTGAEHRFPVYCLQDRWVVPILLSDKDVQFDLAVLPVAMEGDPDILEEHSDRLFFVGLLDHDNTTPRLRRTAILLERVEVNDREMTFFRIAPDISWTVGMNDRYGAAHSGISFKFETLSHAKRIEARLMLKPEVFWARNRLTFSYPAIRIRNIVPNYALWGSYPWQSHPEDRNFLTINPTFGYNPKDNSHFGLLVFVNDNDRHGHPILVLLQAANFGNEPSWSLYSLARHLSWNEVKSEPEASRAKVLKVLSNSLLQGLEELETSFVYGENRTRQLYFGKPGRGGFPMRLQVRVGLVKFLETEYWNFSLLEVPRNQAVQRSQDSGQGSRSGNRRK